MPKTPHRALAIALLAAALLATAPAGAAEPAGPWTSWGDAVASGSTLRLTTAFTDAEEIAFNLSGRGAEAVDVLAAAAGLPAEALDLSPEVYATEGSLALRTVTVSAGDTLWIGGLLESTDTVYEDRAFVVIGQQVITLATASQAAAGPWRFSFQHRFDQAGPWQVGLGVVDSVDVSQVSQLSLDRFEITPVPEPGALALMLGGLGLLAVRARRTGASPAA